MGKYIKKSDRPVAIINIDNWFTDVTKASEVIEVINEAEVKPVLATYSFHNATLYNISKNHPEYTEEQIQIAVNKKVFRAKNGGLIDIGLKAHVAKLPVSEIIKKCLLNNR
jgi:hypothetical protein